MWWRVRPVLTRGPHTQHDFGKPNCSLGNPVAAVYGTTLQVCGRGVCGLCVCWACVGCVCVGRVCVCGCVRVSVCVGGMCVCMCWVCVRVWVGVCVWGGGERVARKGEASMRRPTSTAGMFALLV